MSTRIYESHVESAALTWLKSLGYAILLRKVSGGLHVQSGRNPLKYTTWQNNLCVTTLSMANITTRTTP